MLIDARTLPPGEQLRADICIVGAGPAGIVLALELLATGARICMLESGGREPRTPPGGESVGYPYFPLDRVATRAFGGTSLQWGSGDGDYWHAVPLDRLDFEARSGVEHSGWPFARAELVPFYERAASLSDAVPFVYSADPAADDDAAANLPIRPGRIVSSFLQLTTATFTRHFDRLADAGNVELLLNATAVELSTEDDPQYVSSVRACSALGRTFSVQARATVLAAGGIENPRLLLLGNRAHPAGLGNAHDLVGRFFMEHITIRSGVVLPADSTLLRQTRLYAPRDQSGGQIQPVLRLHEAVTRDEELLNVAFLADARPRAAAAEGVRSLSTLRQALTLRPRVPGLARHAWNTALDIGAVVRTRRYLRNPDSAVEDALVLRVQAEQEPNHASRISLADARDGNGIRVPRLDWRLSELDLRSIRRTQELLDQELRLAELGSVEDKLGDERPAALVLGIHHHMGTTRMHADPKRGVVDADCRLHGFSNVFVTGTSVFPTSGWANPTLTVVALAIRLADHLKTVVTQL
jgi:choline dehydrogenase-like flavoprotein